MREAVRERVRRLYADVDEALARHAPRCEMSGRCCDFPTSGHRLFASALEVEYALHEAGGEVPAAASGLCPWYVDGQCRLRTGRPLGCRIYFCDPSYAEAMPEIYEEHHRRMIDLHEEAGLRYRYDAFVDAVRERRSGADEPREGGS